MKIVFRYILLLTFLSCAKAPSKKSNVMDAEVSEEVTEKVVLSTEDAYLLLITQKLQEYIDKTTLADSHPDFEIETGSDSLFSPTEKTIKDVEFVAPFKLLSDSVKSVQTKVIFESKTDTILTYIQTSETEIDGENHKTTTINFVKPVPTKKIVKKRSAPPMPSRVTKFSLRDLSFTWEEINACDCLFMVQARNTSYRKQYFGRFNDNSGAILQLSKKTEKFLIPILKSRSKNRKAGSKWEETYQSDRFKIEVKATPTQSKVRGKYTYYIDYKFIDLSSKEVVKNLILANCKA